MRVLLVEDRPGIAQFIRQGERSWIYMPWNVALDGSEGVVCFSS